MSIASDNLIHFLGRSQKDSPDQQFSIFKNIIKSGLRTSKITIKFTEGASIINQAVCFTDIPLSECDEHTSIYGKFGIGFRKSYVKGCGGNPARYFVNYMPGQTNDSAMVENRGQLFLRLCQSFNVINHIQERLKTDSEFSLHDQNGDCFFNHQDLQNWIANQVEIFSYEKEMGDLGPARDETKEMDLYYREREWRLVPSLLNLISSTIEPNGENFYYKFTRNDVNMIVAPNNDIRFQIVDFLSGLKSDTDIRLSAFAASPVPVICYDELRRW